MTVLVTRPEPDNETTATALRAKGHEVLLSPMLRFEAQEPNQHCVFEFHSDKKTPG